MNPAALDTEAAARYIGLAASTLEKQRCAGGGVPFVKLGRAVRYRVADLDAYLASRVINSTSERGCEA